MPRMPHGTAIRPLAHTDATILPRPTCMTAPAIWGWWSIALVLIVALVPVRGAELTDQGVRESIRRGADFLRRQQDKRDGGWTEHPAQPGGLSALCTLALLNSGVDRRDPQIQQALSYLRRLGNPKMTYSTALQTMVFCAAEPEKDRLAIRQNVDWLETIQIKDGERRGAWGYSANHGNGDNSNSQFALMALHEAQRVGVPVQAKTWEMALDFWQRCQKVDGSWGYHADEPSTGSMTCAGISALVMAAGGVGRQDAAIVNGVVHCCQPHEDSDGVARALNWLGNKFSVSANPSPLTGSDASLIWRLYYLYGVERVGRLTGQRFFGQHDWYREGAAQFVAQQDSLSGFWEGEGHAESNRLVATSLSLLFLSKGRRPVVMATLRLPGGEGINHRSAVRNLTWQLERRWKRDLSWQTIDLEHATVADLLETPVLYWSGHESFALADVHRQKLREYVQQGGFIFAEACCGGEGFDRSFRQLIRELFPESSLRLLPPEHAIWFAEEPIDSNYLRPLYGLDACCRTGVVFCPQNLSCFWELQRDGRPNDYPANINAEIDACVRIGMNVVTYATNRELKEKLDRPRITQRDAARQELERGVLYVPNLAFQGSRDDAPNALPNLLSYFREQTQTRVSAEQRVIRLSDEQVLDYPILFMHGRHGFRWTAAERQVLTTYLERGGLLVADAICGSPEFTEAFRREVKSLFPDQEFHRMPPDHPVFTSQFRGFDLSRVTIRDPQIRQEGEGLKTNQVAASPLLEGVQLDDRWAVIFSPYDLSCALENATSVECKGYVKADAVRLGINILLFGLQQ